MTIRNNKQDIKVYVTKELKEEFRYYTNANNSDMSRELSKYIESYVRKAKRQERATK